MLWLLMSFMFSFFGRRFFFLCLLLFWNLCLWFFFLGADFLFLSLPGLLLFFLCGGVLVIFDELYTLKRLDELEEIRADRSFDYLQSFQKKVVVRNGNLNLAF